MKRKIIGILICLSLIINLLPCAAYAGAELLSVNTSGGDVVATYTGATSLNNIVFLAEFDKNGNLKNLTAKKASKNMTLSLPYKTGNNYKTFALKKNSAAPVSESAEYTGIEFDGTVEIPVISGSVAKSTALAVREYAKARVLVDELLALDIDEVYGKQEKYNEYMQKINDAKAAYDNVLKSAAVLDRTSAHSAAVAEVQLRSMRRQAVSLFATQDEQLHWAEQITKQYDSIKSNKKLGELGKMLGCDAKEAYERLTAAQDILRGKYMSDANTADNWVKGLTVVKTGCKVALVAGGVGAAAAAGGATLLGAAGICVGGVDATIDIGRTTAVVAFGDDSKIVKHYEDAFEPITTATMIFSVLTLNSASAAEKIACLGDVKQYIQDKTGFSIDDLILKPAGTKIIAEVLSEKYDKENFMEFLKDPAFIGNDRYDRIKDLTESFEENRGGKTEEKLVEVLKEEELIEENETIDDFEDEIKEFDKESKEELAKKKSEEEDGSGGGGGGGTGGGGDSSDTIRYREEYSGSHLEKYYEHKNGFKVGLYEDYIYNRTTGEYVLVHTELYDDNGTVKSVTWYNSKTGRISSNTLYSDGYNLGSIITHIQYYDSDSEIPEYITEPIEHIWQEIMAPYIDDESGEESTYPKDYFGECYHYSPTGVLWEHSTGIEGDWDRTEVYDDSGNLTLEYYNNYDGTYTENSYYTKMPIGGKFNPAGHLQYSQIWTNGDPVSNGVPCANSRRIVDAEEWLYDGDGYQYMYGYVNHQTDGDYKYTSPHTGIYYSDGYYIKVVDVE